MIIDKRKKSRSKEVERKISESNKINTKNYFDKHPEAKLHPSIINKGKHFSPESEFKKGHIPWNKGKYIDVDRTGLINYYKTHDVWNKGLKGNVNSGSFKKGHKFSKETMEKLEKNRYSKMRGSKLTQKHKDKIIQGHIGKRLSEATKEKIRISYTKKRKNWKTPIKDTSIEIKIQNFLKQLGIEFFTHQYMREIEHGYQCDVLIPSMNLVIECDGDYWHKYPVGNDIDHIRTSELINKGFKVLRLWECEIKEMDVNKFEERLFT